MRVIEFGIWELSQPPFDDKNPYEIKGYAASEAVAKAWEGADPGGWPRYVSYKKYLFQVAETINEVLGIEQTNLVKSALSKLTSAEKIALGLYDS